MTRGGLRSAILEALAGMARVDVLEADLAAELGVEAGMLARELLALRRSGRVETWPEAGGARWMLAAEEARRRGVIPAPGRQGGLGRWAESGTRGRA